MSAAPHLVTPKPVTAGHADLHSLPASWLVSPEITFNSLLRIYGPRQLILRVKKDNETDIYKCLRTQARVGSLFVCLFVF